MTIEWVLGIISALLGGLNIFQLICWRSEKQKHQAEADSLSIDAQQKKLDLTEDGYDYLLEKLTKYQQDYFNLADQMQQEMRKHTELINQKCNEIAELKSKLIYFRGLRCYKSECPHRIKDNPRDYHSEEQ